MVRVPTVNSPEARAALAAMRPDVVVVNGTRVIDPETLASVPVPILNMHAGITPLYRGVHGGYWALAEGRNDLVGTTVHLVSPGIDTGRVVGQATFEITPEDDFTTYPFLHVAHGLPLLLDAIADASAGRLSSRKNPLGLSSMLRSHPTAWSYLKGRARLGVR
ncbi:MAG: formyl transferase [Isosphaeraceae bacterium]